jgi:calcineurin-like phosphoesterase family protein
MDNTVVTSDTHAFHANIIKYSKRPFANVFQMNLAMATHINEALPNGGHLIHCGDWSFGGIKCAETFRSMLADGIKVTLILGNHDKRHRNNYRFKRLFQKIYVIYETKWCLQDVVFCHYAMRVWDKCHYGTWHLYGHSHGYLRDDPASLSFDCGVDCHNFKPLTFEEARAIISRKTWKPVDHQRPK